MKSAFTHRSFLLALALFFQAEGMLLVNGVQQYCGHQDMQQQLANGQNEFQTLSMSLDAYTQSLVDHREISYEGKMYDIKSVEVAGDKVTLVVLRDQQEEDLLQRIGEFFVGKKGPGNTVPVSLYQLLTDKYVSSFQKPCLASPSFHTASFSFLFLSYPGFIPALPGPPPKLI